jgi:tetratricopeptide (TPR) repeat protein
MRRSMIVTATLLSLSLGGPAAFAADTPTPPPAAPTPAPTLSPAPAPGGATATTVAKTKVDHMAAGRAAKDRSDWKTAISEFQAAVDEDATNADAHNLLAYSYRKSGNLPKAFEHYEIALRLNPNHRGAHEYRGEAFIMAGELAKAKADLAALEKICGKTCEEYKDLAEAIAKAESTSAAPANATPTTVANAGATPTTVTKAVVTKTSARTKKPKKR